MHGLRQYSKHLVLQVAQVRGHMSRGMCLSQTSAPMGMEPTAPIPLPAMCNGSVSPSVCFGRGAGVRDRGDVIFPWVAIRQYRHNSAKVLNSLQPCGRVPHTIHGQRHRVLQEG